MRTLNVITLVLLIIGAPNDKYSAIEPHVAVRRGLHDVPFLGQSLLEES